MPGFLLNKASQVMCAHGGAGKPVVPLPRVKVMGQPLVGEATPFVISGCPYKQPSVPPVPFPCTLALGWQLPAVRVKAMGLAVLLADSKATCIPSGVPTMPLVPAQARVKGT